MKNQKSKKIIEVVFNIILYVFLIICVFSVLLTVLSKKDSDGATDVFGYQLRLVETNSMGASSNVDTSKYNIKSVPQGSLIIVECVPENEKAAQEWYDSLEVGDVITFRYNNYDGQKTITHRIDTKTELEDGSYELILKGDNVNGGTQTVYTNGDDPFNYVIGKVTFNSYALGRVMGILSGPYSLVAIIIVCFIIIMIEIIRIINTLNADRRQRVIAEGSRKDEEIIKLRQELEKLKSTASNKNFIEELNATKDNASSDSEKSDDSDDRDATDN